MLFLANTISSRDGALSRRATASRVLSYASVVRSLIQCRPRCTLAYWVRIVSDMASITTSGFMAEAALSRNTSGLP